MGQFSMEISRAAGSVLNGNQHADEGMIVARYPEFDYVTGLFRPQWSTLRENPALFGTASDIDMLREARSDLVERLSTVISASRVSRQERVKRKAEGEFLDIDAAIAATISWRAGEVPDTRVYGRHERRSRDMSVLLLIDVSNSTNDRLRGGGYSVLETEKLAAAILGRAIESVGDPFAIAAFCSNTREDVRYFRIKDFGRPFDDGAIGRLAGLKGSLSTRLGTVIRHAGVELAQQKSYRRLLLVISDGEPSDIDVDDRNYLVGDARAAVHELNREGIDVFCAALASGDETYAPRIFGPRNSVALNSIERLPDLLPAIFFKLAH